MQGKIRWFLYITLITISGCAALATHTGITAIQAASYGTTAYVVLPGGEKVKLSNPDGGAVDPVAFQAIESVVTDDLVTLQYLEETRSALFPVVKLTKHRPITDTGRAKNALQNGVQAFLQVTRAGPSTERTFLSSKIRYGSITVRVITTAGQVVYDQTASLVQKANSVDSRKVNQVVDKLAPVLLEDLQKAKNPTTTRVEASDDNASEDESTLSTKAKAAGTSVKGFFKKVGNGLEKFKDGFTSTP